MRKTIVLLICVIALEIVFCAGCGFSQNEKEAKKRIEKLMEITEIESNQDYYDFINADWTIRYSKEKEIVKFEYDCVEEFLIEAFGYECMYEGRYLEYDFKKNAVTIYLDGVLFDRTVLAITYDMNVDDFKISCEEGQKELPQKVEKLLEEYTVAENMQECVENFKSVLQENKLTYEEISSMNYQEVDKYFETHIEELLPKS